MEEEYQDTIVLNKDEALALEAEVAAAKEKGLCKAEAFSLFVRLFLYRSTNGANASASAAADAGISIDNVFAVASRDSGYGALSLASTASDTLVVNYICHSENPPPSFCDYILPR